MDCRTFAVCLILTFCFIKQSDAQITAWGVDDTGGTAARVTGTAPAGTATVSVAENVAAGTTLFTVTGTATASAAVGYMFVTTDGNPSTLAETAITSGAVVLATGKSFDFETTTSYVFMIVATETVATTNSGTVTVTLSITDAVEFTPKSSAVCLSSTSVAASTSIATLSTDQTSPTFALSGTDSGSFDVSAAGAVTVKTGQTLETTTKYYYTAIVTGSKASVTDGTTVLHVVLGCSCSGAGQVAALLSVVIVSVATALLY